jgi:NAD(P)-dependent dehydrogenase (short-subunit alcohol dehydrogenase family)
MAEIALTGASAGIGAAAAIRLTELGHSVTAIGRSSRKLRAVHEQMVASATVPDLVPEPIAADFASLTEVRRLAAELLERRPRIDVLVNNAGIEPPRRSLSSDGFELTFAVNHLAPFLLTCLLADRLGEARGRVITTASSNHEDGYLDFSDPQLERSWSKELSYGRSKLANILFTLELRRRTGLATSSFHPGSIRTDLNRDIPLRFLLRPYELLAFKAPSKGAETLVWLATSEEGQAPRALYYADCTPAEATEAAEDADLAAKLWRLSEVLTGVGAAR